jgi:NADPH-dependent glutamate synthase beta subunit-like oxidoreductase/succinate dehydrogenase/fumarate reductase-like Fe-S protein
LDTIKLNIDGREVQTEIGKTVLQAALEGGIYIPHLCYHPDLTPAGVCRLCIVEIEGKEGLPSSCMTPAADGMVVKTKTPQIDQMRLLAMELILSRHPADCTTCSQYLNCELQSVKQYLGTSEELSVRRRQKPFATNTNNPLFVHDFVRCILCGRCVRACHDLRGVEVLSFINKGKDTYVGTAFDRLLADAGCRFCGACVEVCPTGALRDKEEFTKGKSRRAARVPCKYTCPVEIDVPRYVRLIAEKKFDEAYAVVREQLPLPSVCSYVCLSYCEEECRRGVVNEPVGIRELKRFVSERHTDLWKKNLMRPEATGKRVAILGSGPAGLTAAYYLARKGHEVTIFEQASLPGGLLRKAISRKRLPKEALEDDIHEIIQAGVKLQLDAGDIQIGRLLEEDKFDAVLLAIGSTFVGPSAYWLKEEGIDLTPQGNIQVDPYNMSTSREGVFATGDATLAGISEDFIRYARSNDNGDDFFELLVDRVASNRGDSFRSATEAIASGKKVAEAIDQYVGGDGDLTESFLPAEDEPNHYLGRQEGFADLRRLVARHHSPVPQYAGLCRAELPLDHETATEEAKRCLRCDLRLKMKPIKFWGDY